MCDRPYFHALYTYVAVIPLWLILVKHYWPSPIINNIKTFKTIWYDIVYMNK